jgi:molybdate transport system ATP-binding protein
MTLWNNISCVIKKQKADKEQIVADIIRTFQLESVKDLYPSQVSGGQQQRAALARILVSNPRILMLDEPFSALDSHLKWNMEQEVMSVLAAFNGTTIFVSHDRDEAYRVSDKIAVMNNGKIEITDSKENIFDAPKTLAAAKITGCHNISRAEKAGDGLLRAVDWGIVLKTPLAADNIKHVAIRAHHFTTGKAESNDNSYPCRVHRIVDEPFEKMIIFSFATGNGAAELHYKLPKSEWTGELTREFVISLPNDKIMYLE